MTATRSTGASLTWDEIDWKTVESQVKRLQMRIAKAVREKRYNKVKSLQRLLTSSYYGKLLSIRRVTQNRGKNTPGIDKVVWRTPKQKISAVTLLKRRGYKTQPLRRIYIPKKSGGRRPLSIPVMKCRAMQALHLLALEPVSETLADKNSYGFRPKRSAADAIEQCFNLLSKKGSARWVLEGDIKSCFDQIDHDWLLKNVITDKEVMRKWLKAGYVENGDLVPTSKGTPQGGIISPTLLLLTLRGLESEISKVFTRRNKVKIVAYADDFVVTGATREVLERKVVPIIDDFLNKRGLRLSPEKTKMTHILEGFDFLGFSIRKHGHKLIIKPAKSAVKAQLEKIRRVIKSNPTAKTETLIKKLNPIIRGWSNYYHAVVAKRTFSYVDDSVFKAIWLWAKKRHPTKTSSWVKKRYFRSRRMRNWIFSARVSDKRGTYNLDIVLAVDTPIRRHIKVRAEANPYDPKYREYYQWRESKRKYRRAKSNGLCGA